MDERKNKMTDERYREILPVAYMTAAIVKGRQPRPVEVGLCARAIVDAEDENNLAYRVAMATKIHCTIVGVKRVPTKANSDKYEITYRTLGRDEDEMIPSPLLNGFPSARSRSGCGDVRTMTGRITGSAGVRSSISTTTRPRRATCRARATAAASSPKPSTSNRLILKGHRMFHDYAPVFIIGMLNSFAEKTENGIIDFDTYVTDPEKYDGFLIYDKSNGKVVCDTCVDELHSDIVGYYDFFDGVDIRVIEDDGIFVDVDFGRSSIVVENGRWYVSNFD